MARNSSPVGRAGREVQLDHHLAIGGLVEGVDGRLDDVLGQRGTGISLQAPLDRVFLSVTTAGAPPSAGAASFLLQAASSAEEVAVAASAALVRNVRRSMLHSFR